HWGVGSNYRSKWIGDSLPIFGSSGNLPLQIPRTGPLPAIGCRWWWREAIEKEIPKISPIAFSSEPLRIPIDRRPDRCVDVDRPIQPNIAWWTP
ncbi:MAG: hypothetical protein ACKN9U_03200, partial [Pirellulaceae bacterium]